MILLRRIYQYSTQTEERAVVMISYTQLDVQAIVQRISYYFLK